MTKTADYKNWTPLAQEKFIEELREYSRKPWFPFYCPDRDCDGQPHSDGEWGWSHARADQKPPPGDWLTWAQLSGRGSGKTRSGAEYTHRIAKLGPVRIGLIAPTGTDLRDVIVEGESGILATAAPGLKPTWEPSKKLLTWPNGAQAFGYSAEEPDRLRGKQFHFAWLDEAAHMDFIDDVWDMLLLGLRLKGFIPRGPHVLVTTTPLPTPWNKNLVVDPSVAITRASTYDNYANLSSTYIKQIVSRFEGTRKGLQELYGQILEDTPGAMWSSDWIESNRVPPDEDPEQKRIVISVDPAGTKTRRSDETGIVVLGTDGDEFYVLDDASGRFSPDEWGQQTWRAAKKWEADEIVAERNYGGDMVKSVLDATREKLERERGFDFTCPVRTVNSRRGKVLRADPVAALYEQGRVHHVRVFPELETQMCSWVPGKDSPDRLDAMVHGITRLRAAVSPAEIALPTRRYR